MAEIVTFCDLVEKTKPNIDCISVHDLKKLYEQKQDLMLIDIREDRERLVAHIPGTLHISRGVLEKKITCVTTDPEQTIYLYCRSGARSVLAADALKKMGYQKVISVSGGIAEWAMFAYPLEESQDLSMPREKIAE